MAFHSSLCLCLVILLVSMIISTNGLQCHICGQFNDGVGSITPCLNYTEANAHLHLKECPRKSDKFCVVSRWNQFETIFIFLPSHFDSTFISQTTCQHFSIKTFFCFISTSSEKIAFPLFFYEISKQISKYALDEQEEERKMSFWVHF